MPQLELLELCTQLISVPFLQTHLHISNMLWSQIQRSLWDSTPEISSYFIFYEYTFNIFIEHYFSHCFCFKLKDKWRYKLFASSQHPLFLISNGRLVPIEPITTNHDPALQIKCSICECNYYKVHSRYDYHINCWFWFRSILSNIFQLRRMNINVYFLTNENTGAGQHGRHKRESCLCQTNYGQ